MTARTPSPGIGRQRSFLPSSHIHELTTQDDPPPPRPIDGRAPCPRRTVARAGTDRIRFAAPAHRRRSARALAALPARPDAARLDRSSAHRNGRAAPGQCMGARDVPPLGHSRTRASVRHVDGLAARRCPRRSRRAPGTCARRDAVDVEPGHERNDRGRRRREPGRAVPRGARDVAPDRARQAGAPVVPLAELPSRRGLAALRVGGGGRADAGRA